MSSLPLIKMNSHSAAVEAWQDFLIGQGLLDEPSDLDFGSKTLSATKAFQQRAGLEPDGVVGNKTYGAAMLLGFNGVSDDRTGKDGAAFPLKPDFLPLVSNADRARVFDEFEFKSNAQEGDKEHIEVLGSWVKDHIITVKIPQLSRINGDSHIEFHKKGAKQLQQLWADWETAGLLHLILTYGGSYNPRFVRGSTETLSNHAFGSAFDINAEWNGYGALPALVGQKGSVRELVEIANRNKFYWGGHFNKPDGMHFEIAKIIF